MKRVVTVLLIALLAVCCAPKKKKVVYYEYESSYSSVDIPYRVQGGVKWVSVKINGMSTDMIFDTGCSTVLISPVEVIQLFKQGLLSEDDFKGKTYSMIADGNITEGDLVTLRSIELTDGQHSVICYNVPAEVSSNVGAPVLLGNAVFDRVASYTFDNDAQLIKFKLK